MVQDEFQNKEIQKFSMQTRSRSRSTHKSFERVNLLFRPLDASSNIFRQSFLKNALNFYSGGGSDFHVGFGTIHFLKSDH